MPTKMAPSQKTQAQTPVVKALNAIFATSVPVIKETAIMKMHIASTRMIGYSATCRICMEELSLIHI